ncbi:unnamed protein product [Sphagnum jensenii]|uniref:Uncharacterized protein n=1 Tax=Sphagnum jensenii TaxID=128206 RepID=A0ABP1C2K8_9BRYO
MCLSVAVQTVRPASTYLGLACLLDPPRGVSVLWIAFEYQVRKLETSSSNKRVRGGRSRVGSGCGGGGRPRLQRAERLVEEVRVAETLDLLTNALGKKQQRPPDLQTCYVSTTCAQVDMQSSGVCKTLLQSW